MKVQFHNSRSFCLRPSHSLQTLPVLGMLAGTWAGLMIGTAPALAQSLPVSTQTGGVLTASAQRSPIELGVVQSPDNQPAWQAISDRLRRVGLPYQIVDWRQVQRNTSFDGITVLFLPDVATLTSDQVLALQDWINRGGKVIVSGAVGRQSPYGVQQALRSLLGAAWGSPLPQPAPLQPLSVASQPWVRQGDSHTAVPGVSLVPTGLASQPLARWGTGQGAAIVVTQQTTYLGWEWGNGSMASADFDSIWLKAAIDRFQDSLPMLPASETAAAPSPEQSAAAVPPATALLQPPSLPNAPALTRSGAAPSRSLPRSAPRAALRSLPGSESRSPLPGAFPGASPGAPTQDPAEQTAPPGLDVQQTSLPISPVEAIDMRQELENLIGRFESALLSANSASVAPDLTVKADRPRSALTASADPAIAAESSPAQTAAPAEAALQQARQNLQEFNKRLEQKDYGGARQTWLQARQLLWNHFPLDRPQAQPEIRAVWLDRGTIVRAGSRAGLARVFDQLAAAGINTVFFETVNAGYPIYPSQIAPEQNPLTRSWDPLAAAVELAHARGMELHAWVWTFAAGNQAHNRILNQPLNYPGPVLTAHPDWANYDNRGSMIPPGQTKPFLDPANPAVRNYLLRLFEEIVTRYPVDGLQLDYIRYPFQDPAANRTYGYGQAARQQFQQLTGVDPLSLSPHASDDASPAVQQRQRQLWQQWTEFRTRQIDSFVADTSQLLHRLRPNLILSTAVFALPESERLQELQQHWEAWAQRGDVDMIALMSYAMDSNRLQRLIRSWFSGEPNLGSALVLPGIRLLHLSDLTVVDQIQTLRDLPSGGYALFAAENLDDSLQTIFNHTQGTGQSRAPIPYRQPFAAAASRFTSLQKEWSYLLSKGELWMRDRDAATWRTQADAVDQALAQLAAHPSAQRLAQARAALQSFRSQFDNWMYLQSLSQSYRVRTWKNRLTTLDNLLNYGERVTLGRSSSTIQSNLQGADQQPQ